jgi:dTDP-4-dehydrorhamnose reductase
MKRTAGPHLLVLGASGLVGWYIVQRYPDGDSIAVGFKNAGPGMQSLDLRDAAAVRKLILELKPEVIAHAAADPNVDRCERDPTGTRAINVDGVRNVVAAAGNAGSRVVYFSSDYVFDGRSSRPYSEGDLTSPINEYGRQKVEAESLVLSQPGGLVCRISGVFGWERGRRECRNFVCQVIERLERGERVSAAGDQSLCPTYAPDIARSVKGLIAAGTQGVVHIAGPEVMTRAGFALLVAEVFGLPVDRIDAIATAELHLAAERPAFSALATSALRSYGIAAPRGAREALGEMARQRS